MSSESEATLGHALRDAWRGGYRGDGIRADLSAGIVVGIIALPLSMALAIASGVPPQHGLYTAIVAGALVAVLGGSRTSVTGPTAAFVVLLTPIAAQYGLGGLLLASMMAGMLLMFMGIGRLGRLIQFVPHPVTTGFTSGIAVVIAILQLKDFLGLTVSAMPHHFLERVVAIVKALPTTRWPDLAIGLLTLVLLWVWPRFRLRIPAALVALAAAAFVAWVVHAWQPQFEVATIGSRFNYTVDNQTISGIPRSPPSFQWPWLQPDGDGRPIGLSLSLIRELSLPALAIAMLGAIESLLCAVVADGMTGHKHDPDIELIALGLGNVVAPLFGGFAATAAIARTAAGIRAGSRSPLAAVVHAAFILLAMLSLAPLLSYLPMASLAALLLIVAWRMSDARHFVHIVRVAPRSDTLVLATCFILTVVFDMVVSVTVGIVLAALLFIRRMAELSNVQLYEGKHPQLVAELPPDVRLYEVDGPLFFGAAEKAAEPLTESVGRARAVIFHLVNVPMIDMTGLVALESAIHKIRSAGMLVALAGVQGEVAEVISRSAALRGSPEVSIHPTLKSAEMFIRLAVPGQPHSTG